MSSEHLARRVQEESQAYLVWMVALEPRGHLVATDLGEPLVSLEHRGWTERLVLLEHLVLLEDQGRMEDRGRLV